MTFYPGYPLIKRGIYYCSRMISAQYGTEFTQSRYADIKESIFNMGLCQTAEEQTRQHYKLFINRKKYNR